MRLNCTKSKNSTHYCIIQDININGKRTTKVYENIGNYEDFCKRAGTKDPFEWAKEYIDSLNKAQKEAQLPVLIEKYPTVLIEKDKQRTFNCGYLFLQRLYYAFGLHKICAEVSSEYKFQYDLHHILSHLLYARIIEPASKYKTYHAIDEFLFFPRYELQHVYRGLEVIAKKMDYIQAALYKNSQKIRDRKTGVLYYDCTNYFFEIEEADGLKQYGKSKENRPTPIVQMGLFMDSDGIPLAFTLTKGNANEQTTLQPLEKKIIEDFGQEKFVVCTDAGLASTANRKFNDTNHRRFITTQSIKKLKKHNREYALDLTKGWRMHGSDTTYNIASLRTDDAFIEQHYNTIFYKETYLVENGLTQRLIITYSVKYQEYQRKTRHNQIERAIKLIESSPTKIGKAKGNDPKRFIQTTTCTKDGEIASKNIYTLNETLVDDEARYDGLYAVCTNLDDDVAEIIKVNHRRWEIEESFRIMKSEFKARPVYLSRDDRIKAHFTTCFLSLFLLRNLEGMLNHEYTVPEIIDTLRKMQLTQDKNNYFPIYKRTDLTDKLHEVFGFRTDYEISTFQQLNKIFRKTSL